VWAWHPLILLVLSVTASAAELTGKPWLDDPAAYINAKPGTITIIGQSQAVCVSQPEALDRACLDAARQIFDYVRPRLSRRLTRTDVHRLIETIRVELVHGKYITDRHAQRHTKSYGELWSQAVLIQLGKRELDAITARCAHIMRQQEQSLFGAAASLVVLGVVIFLLYVALNWLTKGYARGRLRAAAALFMLGGAGIVIWIVQNVT
jgi:hypothetical protein